MAIWYEQIGPLTVFDLETTGFSPVNDRIIEIAAIRVEKNGNISKFHSFVYPECPIKRSALKVHGINEDMLKNSAGFDHVGKNFHEFIKNSTLAAHNAKFDLAFLQESFFRVGLPLWNGKTVDTLPIIKKAFPDLPSYKLTYLRDRLVPEKKFSRAHRAVVDVEITLKILIKAFEAMTGIRSSAFLRSPDTQK